jgi:hypothetical protein
MTLWQWHNEYPTDEFSPKLLAEMHEQRAIRHTGIVKRRYERKRPVPPTEPSAIMRHNRRKFL